jgi:1,4-dihydroxy-6-naphthoate synthase
VTRLTSDGASLTRLVRIRFGHSPDPDDAFMYWGLTTDLVDTRGFTFEQVLGDIQTLNQWARAARLELSAISLAAYPFVQDDYALLPHGASIGTGYGPIVVARDAHSVDELRRLELVVPGAMTTAFLTLRLVLGDFAYRELAFERIPEEVASGRAAAGLLIHEGQLTFSEHGLLKVLDLGEWWLLETGLPLPLGVVVARRDLGPRLGDLAEVLAEAIQCSLDHRADALEYALAFGRGIDAAVAERFVAMYVNELTQDYGQEGRKAVAELLRRGESIGAFPGPVRLDFIG